MTRVLFGEPPVVGLVLMIDGQRYELAHYEPHTRQDGTQTELAVWASSCRRCGVSIIARGSWSRLPETRNCPTHRLSRGGAINSD